MKIHALIKLSQFFNVFACKIDIGQPDFKRSITPDRCQIFARQRNLFVFDQMFLHL